MSKEKESPNADPHLLKLPWSPAKRRIASLVLAFHVAAVVIAPWSGPPPSSDLSQRASRAIRPYLDGLGINYGYRFFAPTPGPSHIVRYRLHMANGTYQDRVFPDLEDQWPRLLYHRHLMVAERVNLFLQDPPMPPQQIPGYAQFSPQEQQRLLAEYQEQGRNYNESRKQFLQLIEPLAQRLMLDHDAVSVELWSVEHGLAYPRDVLNGVPLDDERFYVPRFVGSFQRVEG